MNRWAAAKKSEGWRGSYKRATAGRTPVGKECSVAAHLPGAEPQRTKCGYNAHAPTQET